MLILEAASLLALLVALPPVAAAADLVWVGNDAFNSSNFSNSGNWQSNTLPSWGYANSLKFNQNLNSNVTGLNYNWGDWRQVNDIFWDSTFTVSRTLSASNGGGIGFKTRIENQSSSTQTVAMELSGGSDGASDIQLNPVKGSLIFSGTLWNDNSKDYVVYGSDTATVTNLTLNTALGPNAPTQANVDFTVAGGRNSAVQVNASQVWAGTTTINSGSFTTANGVTLASTAIVVGGGTFATNSANTLADTASLTVNTGRLSIGGSDTVASLAGSGGTVNLAAGATLSFGDSGSSSYAGAITGSGNLTKVGSGTFTLSAASSVTGTTTVSAGQFSLGGSNLLADSSAVAVAGGVLALGGNSDTVGALVISGGSLTGSGTVTAASYTLGGGTVSANLGSGTMNVTGNSSLNGTSNGTTLNLTSGTLILGSAGRLAATSALALTGSAGAALALGGNETIGSLAGAANVALGSAALTVGGNNTSTTYSGNLSGSGLFTKLGSGTLTLTGVNSNSGGVAMNAGMLALGSANSLGSTGTISFGGGTLQFSAANTADYSSRFSTVSNQQFRIDTNGQNVTLASNMTSAGTGSLTKLGAGTLTLGGTNLIYGTVAIDEGVLAVASNGAFQTANTISFGGGTLQYASNTALLDYSSRFSTAAGQQYRIDTNSYNVSFMSPLTSVGGSLMKLGAGMLQLAGTNSYSGGTTVSGGVLAGTVAALQGNIVNNAVVAFLGSTPGTYSGVMSGTGALQTQISGELVLAGANTYSGGTVVFSNSKIRGTTGSVQGAIQNAGIVEFAQPAAGTYAAIISGTGSVTKTGAGVLEFSEANTYTGVTSVLDGGLKLNGSIASSLSVASIASLSGTGTVGGNATIIGTHSPGNSPGAQTFNANLTYQAGAVVNWELIANNTGAPGTNYDQIIMPTGNLAFSGSTTLALSFNSAGSAVDWTNAFWNVNRSWTVYDLSGGSTTGLGNLVLGGSLLDSLGNSLSPTARGYFTTSLSGQDVILNFVAVPEPSTVGLALAGLACGGWMARRRRCSS